MTPEHDLSNLPTHELLSRGDALLRRLFHGVAHRPLPSYPSPPPWASGETPLAGGGALRVNHQGFDLLVTILRPGEFDEQHLVRLRWDRELNKPWWHVSGDHLASITVRVIQEVADRWPLPENWRDGISRDRS